MSNEVISMLVRCQYDAKNDATRLQIVEINSGKKIRLRNNYFLLRISLDDATSPIRCLVRHLPDGQEIHVQTGSNVHDFLKAYLLDSRGGMS